MKRHAVRTLIVTLIATGCVIWTIYLFDWQQIGIAVTRVRWGLFAASGFALIVSAFALRGLRWLIVLGLPLDRLRLWQSFCINGAASGLASITPLQSGEILKIKTIPEHSDSAWQRGALAFFVERVLDLAGVAGMGLFGLSLHFGQTWFAAPALLLPVWSGQLLYLLGPLTRYLPAGIQRYGKLLHHYKRITVTSLITVLLWLSYAALWWTAVSAINVSVDFGQISLLLGGVMLTVIISMAPGGLGVAELGSKGILLWLGKPHAEAEAAAIALRLLTPFLVFSGGLCMLLLLLYKHATSWNRRTDQP